MRINDFERVISGLKFHYANYDHSMGVFVLSRQEGKLLIELGEVQRVYQNRAPSIVPEFVDYVNVYSGVMRIGLQNALTLFYRTEDMLDDLELDMPVYLDVMSDGEARVTVYKEDEDRVRKILKPSYALKVIND